MTHAPAPFPDDLADDAFAPPLSAAEEEAAFFAEVKRIGLSILQAMERQALAVAPPPGEVITEAVPEAAPEAASGAAAEPASPAAPPAAPVPSLEGLALAYSRVSRALRQAWLLEKHFADERRKARENAETHSIIYNAFGGPAKRRQEAAARKAKIERIVLRIADEQPPFGPDEDSEAAERLEGSEPLEGVEALDDDVDLEQQVAEACERYDDEDVWGSILNRPISEVVELICRDLGLSPDWPALARQAWAQEELAGDKVGPPLARFRPGVRPRREPRREPRPIRTPEPWPERPPDAAPPGRRPDG